ncbi:hypothetical protein PRZ48_002271 [Zasmidium cellare]|uniref:Amine oxidase domain-containing protein n=1 Tax=Zasmidium cellare TaxID=395010 RepID=A0ABR0F3S1_ZASCE|nr:hypothetical protein PRZ48_002271 [Zasmidium cellare]
MLDVEGPWFDGVSYLQTTEPGSAFVASSKKQRIGIIGAGMAGLMTGHLLDSVGIHNWTILEASNRLGGRVLTAYLNGTRPDQYQYQEMGGMRFPVSVQDPETGKQLPIKDHRMVFQLADVLNNQNGNVSTYKFNFIPWTQEEPNDPADTLARRPDGTVPGAGSVGSSMYEVEDADSPVNINQTMSLGASAQAAESAYYNWTGIMQPQTFRLFVKNIFEAHRQAVDTGYFDWSESQYIWHVLSKSINTTDDINTIANNNPSWLYENIYGAATQWLTVDQGLSRLPQAFEPQVLNRTQFNTSVQGIAWNGSSVIVKHTPTDQPASKQRESAFDHVITSVPFSLVRLWDLPPYSSLLSRAIQNLQYTPVCKVALRYKTRFWEHLPQPILGGCGAVNISGIGNICYPSYKINSTGPGVLLGSYVLTEVANSLAALSDAAHIALVQRAMVSIHGPVAEEQYTGEYVRKCWGSDPFAAGGWASPVAGQQPLYLPAYFRTEFNSIFIGEHTSYTQAWVWSALESSVRGTTQLLLDLGLVDEAKMIVDTWMARWMRL